MEMTKLLITAILLIASLAAQAEIYRWVDEKGQVHYSDSKSTEHESENVKVKSQLVGTVKLSSTIKEAAAKRAEEKVKVVESPPKKSSTKPSSKTSSSKY